MLDPCAETGKNQPEPGAPRRGALRLPAVPPKRIYSPAPYGSGVSDFTLFDVDIRDSFTFHPTTLVGSDAFESADAARTAAAPTESESESESESDGGIGRALLTAVVLAVVSTVVAVAVARLLSGDGLSDLSGLDETETQDDGARVPPSRS